MISLRVNHFATLPCWWTTEGLAIAWRQCTSPGVGVTEPICSAPLFSSFFRIVETQANYWISHLYLTGVAAAQLWRHLSNMNVIKKNITDTFARSEILLTEKLMHRALVTPTPGWLWFHPRLEGLHVGAASPILVLDAHVNATQYSDIRSMYLCHLQGYRTKAACLG